jgi:hypothetical protein
MTQAQTLDILKTGANVFLTGEPGSGKTHVLNQYIEWLEARGISVAVTASTGIAATHIGGMTIHSWSGIGARDTLTSYDLDQIAGKERLAKRINKAQVLVLDEISMLDGRVLDMVDSVCRTLRRRNEAFGGLQVVLVGDFFQLPPVTLRGEVSRFAFESRAWESARFLTCYLTEQHRHEDELLAGLLFAIRKNDVDEDHYTLLQEQNEIGYEDIEPTKLYTHNKDVDEINLKELAQLNTDGAKYKMEMRGNKQLLTGLVKSCLSPELLEIKREAMVMCTKNNFEAGYVNGTLGRVVDFDRDDGYPIIQTSEGKSIKIVPATWSVEENGKVLAEVTQVPLRLAWAITVHKSQGMSLDAAEIDLRNAFTYGQGYVALSRVRTLTGLKVLGINSQALVVDPRIVLRDDRFQSESDDAESVFAALGSEEITDMQKQFMHSLGGSWKAKKGSTDTGERLKKESTYEATKELLLKGLNAETIAKERGMAASTIWGHIEKLAEEGALEKKHIATLIPSNISWKTAYPLIARAYDKHGTEKLKPVYEETGEKYDYNVIRLGRIFYTLSEK